jgi:hypothetical protein
VRIRIVCALVVGVVAATGLVTAAPAQAAVPGLQYVTMQTVTDSTVYKSITVPCPSGLSVIGLGYELVGGLGSVVLDDFIPNPTSITVGAGEVVGPGEPADGTTDSWSVKATAVCAVAPAGLQIVSQTSAFTTGHSRQVFADCPTGKRVIGAGASLSNGWGQISIRGLSIGDSFTVAQAIDDEDGYSGSWSITSYAVCANALPGLLLVSGTSATNSTSLKNVSAVCPIGNVVIGVGWTLDPGNEVYAASAFLGTGQNILFGTEDADGYGGNWSGTAQAICANT